MPGPPGELPPLGKTYREGGSGRAVLGDVSGASQPRGSVGLRGRGGGGKAPRRDPVRGLSRADEPTGTREAEAGAGVLALLDGLAREAGKTVVMVTHSREVVGVADRIFDVQRGRLVEAPAAAGAPGRTGAPARGA